MRVLPLRRSRTVLKCRRSPLQTPRERTLNLCSRAGLRVVPGSGTLSTRSPWLLFRENPRSELFCRALRPSERPSLMTRGTYVLVDLSLNVEQYHHDRLPTHVRIGS